MCNKHDHDWVMVETGYERQWRLEFDEETRTIRAFYGGSEDWSDEGDGDEHLRCSICLKTKPLPDDWEVEYE